MKREEITKAEAEEIAQLMQQRHQSHLNEGEYFEVSGYRSLGEVYTQVILRNVEESLYYPVECQIDLLRSDIEGPLEAMYLLLDFQDYYFSRYLSEDRDVYLAIDWAEYQFEDHVIVARGQIFNRKLEQIADRLLAGEKLDEC